MAIVVSDTSPIRALGHLGLIDLLHHLYSEVLVPPAVDEELKNPPVGTIAVDVGGYAFIRLQAPIDATQVDRFLQVLDLGESEALALALEVHADLVLLDESKGRAEAMRHGLVPIGVLGTLARAKHRGYIDAIAPLIDRLQDELRFFISPALKTEVLRSAGERP